MAEFTDNVACGPFVTPEEVMGCCKIASDNLTIDDPRLLDAIEDATTIIYYLTGRQFGGTCTTTVRPCNPWCCNCTCGSCKPNEINLGVWPVTAVTSVRIDGTTLTGSDITDTFHVDEWRYLVRNDGNIFPHANSAFAIAGSAEDVSDFQNEFVFEVTVEHGMTVPRLITRATRAMACQLVSFCLDLPCKLPERVTSVSRQGVSMNVSSTEDFLTKGRTGIYEVDLALATFNPNHLQSSSFMWSGQQSLGRRVNT